MVGSSHQVGVQGGRQEEGHTLAGVHQEARNLVVGAALRTLLAGVAPQEAVHTLVAVVAVVLLAEPRTRHQHRVGVDIHPKALPCILAVVAHRPQLVVQTFHPAVVGARRRRRLVAVGVDVRTPCAEAAVPSLLVGGGPVERSSHAMVVDEAVVRVPLATVVAPGLGWAALSRPRKRVHRKDLLRRQHQGQGLQGRQMPPRLLRRAPAHPQGPGCSLSSTEPDQGSYHGRCRHLHECV